LASSSTTHNFDLDEPVVGEDLPQQLENIQQSGKYLLDICVTLIKLGISNWLSSCQLLIPKLGWFTHQE
jgi:hypothetical protein